MQLFLDQKGISFCGLYGAERSFSKQRNKHQQRMLMEAVKMAPRNSPDLAMIYDKRSSEATRIKRRWPCSEARSVFGGCRSAPKRLSGSSDRKPHRR